MRLKESEESTAVCFLPFVSRSQDKQSRSTNKADEASSLIMLPLIPLGVRRNFADFLYLPGAIESLGRAPPSPLHGAVPPIPS